MTPLLLGLLCAGQPAPVPLRDKTLVAWVKVTDPASHGGSALTLDNTRGHFDGIIYGERAPRKWMAGSDGFLRTQGDQAAVPEEQSTSFVQVAVAYRGNTVTLFRDGKPLTSYEPKSPALTFNAEAVVLFGMRHLLQNDNARFAGLIDDARIYASALTGEQLATLKPNADDGSRPWAHWTFDAADAGDRTGRFPAFKLLGGAKVAGGSLHLDGKKATAIAATDASTLSLLAGGPPPSVAVKPVLPGPDIEAARRLRNHLLADPYRPAYHFAIPEDYAMPFDPNGAILWKGRHHLFYIYQERGVHCFGHVSSHDLLHWRQHPPAVFPTPDSPERGIFSGNCFLDRKGRAVMLYHGVNAGNCIAIAEDDNLEQWKKLPANPIVPNPGPKEPFTSWDPHGWFDGTHYYAVFGGQPSGSPKPAAVFKAKELDQWRHVGPFLHHDLPGVQADEDISCPDFFELGGKRVLVCISHNRGARYYVGDWKNEQFHPQVHERLTWNDNLYFAPETMIDAKGRRVLWAWVFDQRGEPTQGKSGWSGELALPRELTLGADNRLRMKPLAELASLRYNPVERADFTLEPGADYAVPGFRGNTCEVLLEVEAQSAATVGLKVLRSPNGEEESRVLYDAAKKELQIDTTKSSLKLGTKRPEAAPFALAAGERLTLRVFVDRSMIEAFGNDRQALVRRAYPSRADSLGVTAFCTGGAVKVQRLTVWQMSPTNPY